MRSIRRGISSSSRLANASQSLYNSVSAIATPDAPSTSWKGKGRAISPNSGSCKGSRRVKGLSRFQAGSESQLSEFEAITRRYDNFDDTQEEKKPLGRYAQFGPVHTFEAFVGRDARLPRLPSGSWINDVHSTGKHNDDLKWTSPQPPALPVPLTHGSGTVDQRVLRSQRARLERETVLRRLVDALKQSEVPKLLSRRELGGLLPVVTTRRNLRIGGVSARVARTHRSVRKYSTQAGTSEAKDSQTHSPTLVNSTQAENDPRNQLKSSSIVNPETSSQKGSADLNIVTTQWPGEKWGSDWGADQLVPPANRYHQGSHSRRTKGRRRRSSKPAHPQTSPEPLIIHPSQPMSELEIKLITGRQFRKENPPDPGGTTSADKVNQGVPPPGNVDLSDLLQPKGNHEALLLKLHTTLKEGSKAPLSETEAPKKPTDTPRSRKKLNKIRALARKAQAKREIIGGNRTTLTHKRKDTQVSRKQSDVGAGSTTLTWKRNVMEKRDEVGAVSGILEPLESGTDVLEDIQPENGQRPVPRLAHGLDRVLFNPSVHWIQDPHSKVYNYPPNLQSLPAVTEFAFERLGSYIKSSHDKSLRDLAQQHRKRFAGSTSSLTGLLSHIYFLISDDRLLDTSTLSSAFYDEPRTFPPGIRMPAEVVYHYRRHQLDVGEESTLTSLEGTPDHPSSSASQPDFLDKKSSLSGFAASSLVRENIEEPDLKSSSLSCNIASETGVEHALPENAEVDSATVNNVPNEPASPPLDLRLPGAAEPSEKNDAMPGLKTAENTQSSEAVTSRDTSKSGEFFETYAIDSGTDDPDKRREEETNVLLWLGTMAEKFLTLPEAAFSAFLRKNPVNESLLDATPRVESYRYAKSSQFVMRAQLDCQDTRLPGTGVFDIKTRAVLPIRVDQLNYVANSGYLIRTMTGLFESFEREYYDLIRSAFLKYNFQARIGNMDGIFVAYHNTARMFGFQYVPVAEMEQRIYGPGHPDRGARIFEKCIGLLEAISNEIVACFPGQSLVCTAEARKKSGKLDIWVTPLSGDHSKRIARITVRVRHTLDDRPVTSQEALDRANCDWRLFYTISRSAKPQHEIWLSLERANARKFPAALPEGMTKEEMEKRMRLVNFGAGKGFDQELPDEPEESEEGMEGEEGKDSMETPVGPTKSTDIKFKSRKRFGKADGRLRYLRQLAQRGWADLQRESAEKQVVFGIDADRGAVPNTDKEPIHTDMPAGAASVSDDVETIGDVEGQTSPATSDKPSLHKSFAHYHL